MKRSIVLFNTLEIFKGDLTSIKSTFDDIYEMNCEHIHDYLLKKLFSHDLSFDEILLVMK